MTEPTSYLFLSKHRLSSGVFKFIVTHISIVIFFTKLFFVNVLETGYFLTVGSETRCMKQRLTLNFISNSVIAIFFVNILSSDRTFLENT